jgi:cytochrome P450
MPAMAAPVSLPVLHQSPVDPDFVQDPYPFYDRARAAGPLVFWHDYGLVCAAGFDVVNALLRDRRLGREAPPGHAPERPAHMSDFYAIDDHSMLEREPPAHTRLRGLVLRAFTARRIAALEGEIAALAAHLADGLRDGGDLIRDFAEPLPVTIIARLLGVPDDMGRQLLDWSHAMVGVYQARRDRAMEDAANRAAAAFAQYLRGLIAARRRAPSDDLISALIAAHDAGDRMSEPEMVATCVLLLNAGHEATVHTIGNGVKALLETGWAGPVTAAVVEEILRFDPPLHMFTRYAMEDVTVAGHRFAMGDRVGLLLAAANRDPARFADPAGFDPARGGEGNLSFGAGLHFCVGAPLARLELAVALPVLFARHPGLRLAEVPRYADLYHFHGLGALKLRL